MSWLPDTITLTGETVKLIPLEKAHFDELNNLAQEKKIWEFFREDYTNPIRFDEIIFNEAFIEKANGRQYPFAIWHNPDQKIIGTTRFLELNPSRKKLEIGQTWIHSDYWGSGANLECKLLLLTYCFEVLGTVRVQLWANVKNLRSRNAIEKIGGKLEGILRNNSLSDNGTRINSALYSIIDSEWNELKPNLTRLYKNKKNG